MRTTTEALAQNFIAGRNLAKEYLLGEVKEAVFKNISVEISQGQFVAITGPSGSGKSTLLNLLGLMDRPSAGEIYFQGHEISKSDEGEWDRIRRTKVGFIFQNFNLLAALKSFENVGLSLLGFGLSAEEVIAKSHEALERVGMKEHAHKFPAQLSGGQRQRVAIARAFVHEPELIVADEPTASLDRKNAYDVMSILEKLSAEKKTTVLMASHDEEMYKKVPRILRLEGGMLHG